MKQAECGQITIFLSLMLISFLLVLSVCIEGIYVQTQKADFMEQQLLIGEYAQANYHKELAEQFHIFAIDGRYVSKMDHQLKQKFQQNTGKSVDQFLISDQVPVTGEEGEILKHQIREYMKYEETTKLVDKIRQSFQGVENDADRKQLKSTLDHVEEPDNDENEGQEKSNSVSTAEDPRKALQKLLSGNILSLVMPAGKEISDQQIAIVYGKENKKTDIAINFFQKQSVSDLLESSEKSNALSQLSTEGLSVLYSDHVFRNVLSENSGKGVQYEMEYLISGKSTDQDNLKSVVYKLLAIRFALNYSYLLSSGEKQAEAYALAAAISNVGSVVPGVIEGVKLLLLAAWAYGEAIVDLRSLLSGKKVPLIKTDATWQLSLSNLGSLSANENTSDQGNDYNDYLKILLLLQLDQKEKYHRMMDLMEQRIREEQDDFQLSACVFSYKMTVGTTVNSLFYGRNYNLNGQRIYAY